VWVIWVVSPPTCGYPTCSPTQGIVGLAESPARFAASAYPHGVVQHLVGRDRSCPRRILYLEILMVLVAAFTGTLAALAAMDAVERSSSGVAPGRERPAFASRELARAVA